MKRLTLLLPLVFSLLVLRCSTFDGLQAVGGVCTPNERSDCECPGGETGWRICSADGLGYTVCNDCASAAGTKPEGRFKPGSLTSGGEGTGGEGQGGSAGSDATPNCGLESGDPDCNKCMQDKCWDPCGTCADNPDCLALLDCLGGAKDDVAIKTCEDSHQDGLDGILGLLGKKEGCLTSKCPMCIAASDPSDALPSCVAYYDVGGCCAFVTNQSSCSDSLTRFTDQVTADPNKASSIDSGCWQSLVSAASGGFCLPACVAYYGEGGCCSKQTGQSGCTQTLNSYNSLAAKDPNEISALDGQCQVSKDYATNKGSCD